MKGLIFTKTNTVLLIWQFIVHTKPINFGGQSHVVGGIPTPLKNIEVSWDDDIPNLWKVIKFHGSKPPTSDY